MEINEFRKEYFYLSNFFISKFSYRGLSYTNAEAAFQSMKTLDLLEREGFQNLKPRNAKYKGRRVKLRGDWETIKVRIMNEILVCKFSQNPELQKALLDTGDAKLIEGNDWGDKTWGVHNGVGKNILGILLMNLRSKINAEHLDVKVSYNDNGDCFIIE